MVHLIFFSCCVKWIVLVHTTCRIKNKNQLILSIAHRLDPLFNQSRHSAIDNKILSDQGSKTVYLVLFDDGYKLCKQ